MIDLKNAGPGPAAAEPRVPSHVELRARMTECDDAIASIRAQIASADMKRQPGAEQIDAEWFYRAKMALRHFRRERAQIRERLAKPQFPKGLKDRIIAVVRPDYDDDAWAAILEAARRAGEAVAC